MRKNRALAFTLSLLLSLLLSAQALAEAGRIAYVTSGGCPAYGAPDTQAQATGRMWYAQLATELERAGSWQRVGWYATSGAYRNGWVYEANLSQQPIPVYRRMAVVSNPDPLDRLHLRARPSVRAASLGKYYNGAVVYLDGPVRQGWANVSVGLARGYMQVKYLRFTSSPADVAPAFPIARVENRVTGQLHLRPGPVSRPGTASWGLFPDGTQVTVLGIGPVWTHVEMAASPYMEGYMMTRHLTTLDGMRLLDLVDRPQAR